MLALSLQVADAEAAKVRLKVETPGGVVQKVYLARPVGLAADRPVVFVLHGAQRNAEEVRDQWYALAEEHDFLVVAPEFSDVDFPGDAGYARGNAYDEEGAVRPRSIWAFDAIEPIFDDLRRRFGMTTDGYSIYGHSAGARFVHRFLMHVPEARIGQAVVANAEEYTLPDFSVDFPCGLRGSAVGREDLVRALQLPLIVLLGDADSDPQRSGPPSTPGEPDRGARCCARGQTFFDAGRAAAADLQVPFGWRLATVPGADHDNVKMASAAIPYLLPQEPAPSVGAGLAGDKARSRARRAP